ncbi:elongation of very long chain fatty acids protein 7-like [Varroa jacobsoni]|uniref:Elongation of very long chain fatty acids protein n=1 Tax=Varroa destructor TaxID=109461 RepID=A0A7M7L802_VARDE|nr:elongation of very long chain fatty acids protein 7-like [Varroa destructor]XP_022710576.1 elongation of very long chain fatty acids protein 7-like [Varroa jacobsoni]
MLFKIMSLIISRMIPDSKIFWSPVDPRTEGWPFVGNLPSLVILLAGYLYVVKVAGPRWMKDRVPFENLKPLMRVYNILMVFANAFMLQYILRRTYLGGGYSLYCQGINYVDRSPQTMELLNALYYYTFVRIIDFLDTIFFVLRKKFSHVSFLHLSHHCLVVFIGWYGALHGYEGQPMLGTCINMFIHIIMYSYYFLASFGHRFKRYLVWKKYLTQLQLIQFVIAIGHLIVPVFEKRCNVPLDHVVVVIGPTIFFLAMFCRFYVQTYVKRQIKLTFKKRSILEGELMKELQFMPPAKNGNIRIVSFSDGRGYASKKGD